MRVRQHPTSISGFYLAKSGLIDQGPTWPAPPGLLRLQWGLLVRRPPAPSVSDRDCVTHGGPGLQTIGGDQLFWGNCESALKSCQALGPEVRNSKAEGKRGGEGP